MLRYILLSAITLMPFVSFSQNGLIDHGKPSNLNFVAFRYSNFVKAAPDNTIWIGLDNSIISSNVGMVKFHNNNWTTYTPSNSGFPNAAAYDTEFAPNNIIWIATAAGLVKFDGSNWIIHNSSNSPLTSDSVFALKRSGGDLWIGTSAGLFKYDGTNWIGYNTSNSGIAGNSIKALEVEGTTVWAGTTTGLSKLSGTNWTNYTTANSQLKKHNIHALKVDANGSVWIGTDSIMVSDLLYSGLYKLENGVVHSVNNIYSKCYSRYLPKNVFSIVETPQGNIIAAGQGQSGFNREFSGIVEFLQNDYKLYFLPDWEPDGIPTYTLGKTQLSIDTNGLIWFTDRYLNHLYSLNRDQHTSSYKSYKSRDDLAFLDVNNVSAPITNRGDMFWDFVGNPQYEVPKGSCKKSLFASALWIGGLDAGGNVYTAAMTYRQQNGIDFFPGPLDTATGTTNSATMNDYDRVWKVNRLTIEHFIKKFQDGSVTNGTYTIPDEILDWPAHGTGPYANNLAPYVDVNNDGQYDPYDGDYPKIKGDQMVYTIFNDNGGPHTETGGDAMGIEVHFSAYAFACPDLNGSSMDSTINYTTFYNYRIINRSNRNYDSVYIGLWVDNDLGYAFDDYIGTNPSMDAAFAYNGSNYDRGWTGYGQNPPMINYMILQGPEYAPGQYRGMSYSAGYPNDFSVIGNPDQAIHYYYYLTGRWKDGSSLTYGGTGYGGTTPTRYMYPDVPTNTSGWSEVTNGNNPGDRRFIMSSGPVTLPSKAEARMDYAIVFSGIRSATSYYQKLFQNNDEALRLVKQWYQNNNFPSCIKNTGIDVKATYNSLSVYPNPANTAVVINYVPKTGNAVFQVYSISGKMVKGGSLNRENSTEVSVVDMPAGIYLVKVSDGNSIYYGKIVKQ